MIYQRFFVGLLVLLIQANLIALGQPNCGNYTSDSAYRANLNATLSSLSTNIGNDGFYNASTGKGPDRANAVVLCKGDLQLNECRECVKEAGAAVMESCPVAKQNIYLGELCTLRYSNESFRGTLATLPRYFVYSDENVTSPEQFKKDLRNLLDDLRGRAAGGSSTRKVAAGNATAPDFQTIFGLVQCTPDLSTEDCTSCLIGAILYIPLCCEESMPTGGAIYVPSCNIRYKTIPFFNTTRLQELEFVPPPPSPPPILEPPPPILEPPPQLSPPGSYNCLPSVINC